MATVAALPTGARHVHVEPVWGTVVTLELRGPELDALGPQRLRAAVGTAVGWLHHVDRILSPFREHSELSLLRRREIGEAAVSGDVQDVLARCRIARDLTRGAFDPWAMPGGVDPCGLVKGWAADRAADLLVAAGYRHVKVDAGGDVVVRGGATTDRPWVLGVQHPDDPASVIATVSLVDGAVATSGTYERGDHVLDPTAATRPARGARAATVVARDGGLADALATALMVSGRGLADVIAGLDGCSALAVDGDRVWTVGPAFD